MKKEVQKDFPKRKKIRLQGYDYSTAGAYFVTICTQDHRKIFWENVGADIIRLYDVKDNRANETVGFQTNGKLFLAEVLF